MRFGPSKVSSKLSKDSYRYSISSTNSACYESCSSKKPNIVYKINFILDHLVMVAVGILGWFVGCILGIDNLGISISIGLCYFGNLGWLVGYRISF